MATMDLVQGYIGEYLSKGWVAKNVLQLSEEEWKDMKDDIEQEKKDGEIPDEEETGDDENGQEVDVGTGADSDE